MAAPDEEFDRLLEVMRRAAAALRDADVPHALACGLAVWARGGPKTEHDVDFMIRRDDVEAAVRAFEAAGHETEDPPEGWLRKTWVDGILVDLIFDPNAGPVDDGVFERAEEMEVHAMRMRVAALEDVIVQKLLALNEQDPDYSSVLELARSLRE